MAIVLALLAAPASASAPLPAGHERYIVVLHAKVRGAAGDLAGQARSLGATVDADLGDRLILTASPETMETLRKHEAVRYVQTAVVGGAASDPGDLTFQAMPGPSMPVRSHAGLTWSSGDYVYDGAGNLSAVGSSLDPGTQGYRTYGYDALTRLTKAEISGVSPGAATYEYGYDVYGNRTASAVNGQWSGQPVSASTNRLSEAGYDVRGNQTSLGVTAATYDGFGMVTSYRFDDLNVETYVYTASDERIGVLRGTDWTWSLRDDDGKVLRQYRSSATNPTAAWLWLEDFVYRDGLLLGSERVAEEGGRRHYHLDHLGSPRLVTGVTGSVISEHDFLPFGEERTSIDQHQGQGFDREEPFRFTSHERDFDNATPNDSSSYVDYMHARHYVTRAGRFLTPDPMLGNLLLPQGWNRYAYVLNSPLNVTDPYGLQAITVYAETPEERAAREEAEARRLAERMMSLLRLRHPISKMTLAEHLRVSELGVTEFVDGVISDWVLADLDDYGEGQIDGLEYSDKIGRYTREIEVLLATAGGTMETRAGAEAGNWVTNNVFRWGKGAWKGSGGARWHFHVGPGKAVMRHHLPHQFKTWRHHAPQVVKRWINGRR